MPKNGSIHTIEKNTYTNLNPHQPHLLVFDECLSISVHPKWGKTFENGKQLTAHISHEMKLYSLKMTLRKNKPVIVKISTAGSSGVSPAGIETTAAAT